MVICNHIQSLLKSGINLLRRSLDLLEILTPLLLATCTLHLKITMNTYHILYLGNKTTFIEEWKHILKNDFVFTNSSVVIALTRFYLHSEAVM